MDRMHTPVETKILSGSNALRLPALAALIAIIAALAAFALGGPTAGAQTPSVTLVSNTGKSGDFESNLTTQRGQAFTTGPSTNGYILTGVDIPFVSGKVPGSGTYSIKILNANGADPGTTTLTTLSFGSLSGSVASWTGSVDLDRETTYFVFLEPSAEDTTNAYWLTDSDDEDDGAATGWSIADESRYRPLTGGSWNTGARAWQIAVNGHEKDPAPVVRSATVEFDELTITFDRALDQDSVPATGVFTVTRSDGTAITVSRVDVSGSTVTLILASLVERGTTVTVDYTPPSSNPLQNTHGVDVAQFTGQRVTVTTPRDVEIGVIYEAIGGEYRVSRAEDGNCYTEYLSDFSRSWHRLSNYGKTTEGCRKAAWNAHRRAMGEEPLAKDSDEFPAGHPPDLNDFTCPSGWERAIDDGQQWWRPAAPTWPRSARSAPANSCASGSGRRMPRRRTRRAPSAT